MKSAQGDESPLTWQTTLLLKICYAKFKILAQLLSSRFEWGLKCMNYVLQNKVSGEQGYHESFESPRASFPVPLCTVVEHTFLSCVGSTECLVCVCSFNDKWLWQSLSICNRTTGTLFSRFHFRSLINLKYFRWLPWQGVSHSHGHSFRNSAFCTLVLAIPWRSDQNLSAPQWMSPNCSTNPFRSSACRVL